MSKQTMRYVKKLAAAGKRLAAIKHIRTELACDYREAKQWYELLAWEKAQ